MSPDQAVAGRGGALGDVRPETVAAVLGLVSPEAVREGWLAVRRRSSHHAKRPSTCERSAALHLYTSIALHEHRAAALLNAVRSSGLSPIQAQVAGPEGEAGAVAFGWQPPYPKPGPLARKRPWADAVADRIAAQPWHALDRDQRAD